MRFPTGTCHIEFNDPALIKKSSIYECQEKGWLPPGYGVAGYDDLDSEAKAVVDSFEGRESYEETVGKSEFYLLADDVASLLALCG